MADTDNSTDVPRCLEAVPVTLACALACWELGLAWAAVPPRPSGPPGWSSPGAARLTDPAAVSSATAGSDKVRDSSSSDTQIPALAGSFTPSITPSQ